MRWNGFRRMVTCAAKLFWEAFKQQTGPSAKKRAEHREYEKKWIGREMVILAGDAPGMRERDECKNRAGHDKVTFHRSKLSACPPHATIGLGLSLALPWSRATLSHPK